MQEQNSVDTATSPSATMMVVDDDDNWILIAEMMLKRAGIKAEDIISAKNGLEAINLLRDMKERGAQLPSIIFLDIKMPVLDGFGFLQQLMGPDGIDVSQTRIYLCISSIHPADRERAKQYPIVAFLNKPLTMEIVEQVLK